MTSKELQEIFYKFITEASDTTKINFILSILFGQLSYNTKREYAKAMKLQFELEEENENE